MAEGNTCIYIENIILVPYMEQSTLLYHYIPLFAEGLIDNKRRVAWMEKVYLMRQMTRKNKRLVSELNPDIITSDKVTDTVKLSDHA